MKRLTLRRLKELFPERKFKFLGQGWDRKVYRSGNIVVKIPLHERGSDCNHYEALNWNTSDQTVVTRIVVIDEVSVAVQPFLEKISGDLPIWCSDYDGGQVGLTRTGKIKAYDFAPGWMSLRQIYVSW